MPPSQRLKVLISAYACEPNKGSEPEVGWQWALQMARFHDVHVLTRANNQSGIEQEIAAMGGRQPVPNFIYFDRSSFLLGLKKRLGLHKWYYVLWQKAAREVVARLHAEHQFDLLHHATFAAYRYVCAVWGHGVACIWGPVGGIESIPMKLLPWTHPASLAHEGLRNVLNAFGASAQSVLPRRAQASTMILSTTKEMQQTFARLGFNSELMPTIGLNLSQLEWKPHRQSTGPLRIFFVGNILSLKGLDLALEALKLSGTDAVFDIVGMGNYLKACKSITAKLALGDRVRFLGRLPRAEVLKQYSEYDVFMFPSLHDTGGYAVIEAMANELPVICLGCGGPGVAVGDGSGIKVALGDRRKIIGDIAAAIRLYSENRDLLYSHGRVGRQLVLENYDWHKKGQKMNECYLLAAGNVTTRNATATSPRSTPNRYREAEA